jgi:hypothetical protein
MLDLQNALSLAATAAAAEGTHLDATGALETRTGWFVPSQHRPEYVGGTKGLIVNKQTGSVLWLGSAYSVERDVALYDKGYQFEFYDLVVTRVRDTKRTLDTLLALRLSRAEPKYQSGVVWRIPRDLTRDELAVSLRALPHVFPRVRLYFVAEVLERAREQRDFAFELLEYLPPP